MNASVIDRYNHGRLSFNARLFGETNSEFSLRFVSVANTVTVTEKKKTAPATSLQAVRLHHSFKRRAGIDQVKLPRGSVPDPVPDAVPLIGDVTVII